ncbi:DNA-binding protein with winged-HTH domain [Terriglobus roseus DSM 18391]|uniref:DNA-binding protein with winged-HTH domain n=1 Tax=Terriglobus roseus (strain DSM 18391 / NRRL B-41598 / KBS 63) TaxID=926566 RepID=I3ZIV4_TERRK|nr:winged helix-turn-helix domain-containing protein [Terriglobus roseus]AFL89172.1 DNA-binding protein with winged-HTH domain [Terriglobus roseus DSM 18391]
MFYCFDKFELSEQEFSLRRDGQRIAIEPRALRVLLVLVGSQGKLLEKKTLLEAVWKDTYVEETTLTRAIAVIRKHLEDDPRAPRYIETIPTRGYRFIAPVEIRPSSADPAMTVLSSTVVADPGASDAVAKPTPSTAPSTVAPLQAPESRAAKKQKTATRILTAFVFGAVALGAFLVQRRSRGASLSTKDTIVLADFTNTTEDHAFDDALRQGMLVQLEQSPVLRLASDSQIRNTLKMMGLHTDAVLTPEAAREVCQRIAGTVVLNGSIHRLGKEYVIGLQARRCSTGEQLDAEQVQVARKEDALNALSQIATRFRTRIGEASGTIHDLDTPLAEATTPSLDALRAFSRGIGNFNTKGSAAAVPLFQQATELDPAFAEAHVWLGRMYADLGQEAASIQSTQKAYGLRERASYRERLSIDVSYELLVTGNLEKAKAACEAWIQMYPRDVYPRAFLSAIVYPAYGQYDRALKEATDSMTVDPDFVVGYRNAAVNLIALNRVGEAEQILQQAAQRKLFLPGFVSTAYRMAFLKGDENAMKRASDSAPTNPWLLHYRAATQAQAGKMTQARPLQEQAVGITRRGQRQETEAELTVAQATTDVLYGYPEAAVKEARASLLLSTARSVEYSAALVLAMTKHDDEALRLIADLRRRFPEDTLVRYEYLPTIQAALALGHNQPQQAIDLLQPTSQFEVSLPLNAVYLRGLSFLAMGKAPQAAAEFQKIVDHPGLVLCDPLLNLAQINLARAYVAQGKREDARANYQKLLQRLSGADAGLPILQQVTREQSRVL